MKISPNHTATTLPAALFGNGISAIKLVAVAMVIFGWLASVQAQTTFTVNTGSNYNSAATTIAAESTLTSGSLYVINIQNGFTFSSTLNPLIVNGRNSLLLSNTQAALSLSVTGTTPQWLLGSTY